MKSDEHQSMCQDLGGFSSHAVCLLSAPHLLAASSPSPWQSAFCHLVPAALPTLAHHPPLPPQLGPSLCEGGGNRAVSTMRKGVWGYPCSAVPCAPTGALDSGPGRIGVRHAHLGCSEARLGSSHPYPGLAAPQLFGG